MINNFDISAVEDEIIGIIRSLEISDNIYPNRPKAAEPAQDFVVVRVDGVNDRSAYGECVVFIELFAKDTGLVKNRKRLSVMYQNLRKGFPASSSRLLFDTEPDVIGDTPDDFGFHARIIRIKTTIKAD